MFRQIIPVTKAARPVLTVAKRGKKNLPVWSPFGGRRSAAAWDDPWFNDFFRTPGPMRVFDDQMRDVMDKFLRMSPLSGFNVRVPGEYGLNAEIVEAKIDDKGMNLKLNVSHYQPDELKVKIVDDRLVILGKHEKKSDEHGFVSREFSRELLLPEEVDRDTLHSRITEDGNLIITAKVKAEVEPEGRTISIEQESGNKIDDGNKEKEST
ncbi:heat shock protein hsp-16.2-like [Littorina saxatilis]|uniref:SHSP domain-containing protein n=1 Tax=Littorina saxatilis TaxID=31220 RepID=A0AAN9B1Z0_9CAEN